MKAFILFGLIILCGCSKDEVVPTKDLSTQMLEAVNKLRREGCQCGTQYMPPVHQLTWDDTLTLAASRHVKDMHDNNYLEHLSPTGTSPIQRAMEAGYT